jgi:hypothetical protein
MNPLPNNLVRTGDAAMKSRADDVEIVAIEGQRPMFAKKTFSARQSFSRNIQSWEGPVKSGLLLDVETFDQGLLR